ncbi:hypothetical protein DFJ43DRAFT_1032853 [Lentinula guzmanii]|uniref:Protein SQS1 n=1 Tax=Lentinula guzmanii TaxID=2804957 RepID=A0AA38JEN2_9AGAR|nr:hypothetical protein DFJ43DRAFT_1032853 [Lentinula guzmanii]
MARGKGSKNNDSFRGKPFRGGSTAGSRGQGYRGRARGGRGGAGGRGGYIGYNPSIDTDFLLQTYNDNYDTSRYYSAPSTPQNRGRGRGGGLGSTYSSQLTYGPPVNRGSRGRGRGRGRGGYDSPRNDSNPRGSNSSYVPLSLSLRPLLRPVIFVPATENRFLFQAEEELIQPIVEDAGDEEKSHIPTADRVARVFSGGFKPIKVEDLNDNSEGLEEIDFNDVGKFQEMMGLDSDAAGDDRIIADQVGEVDERFSEKAGSPFPGDSSLVYIAHSSNTAMDEPNDFPHNAEFSSVSTRDADADPRVSSIIKPIAIDDIGQPQKPQTHKMAQHVIPTFFIDADPSRCSPDLNQIPVTDQILGLELGASSTSDALDDGDDIVVYVAPHPRQGRSTAPTPIPWRSDGPSEVSTTSILTGLPIGMAVPAVGPAPTVDSIAFSSLGLSSAGPSRSSDSNLNRGDTTGLLNVLASAQARVQNRPGEEEGEGGLVNEQSLNKRVEESIEGEREGGGGGNDQKTPTPILSFSFTTSPGAAEGMQVDPELEIDLDTMKRFVEGMGPNGSRHVTMYDLEVERRVEIGDKGDEEGEDDGEDEYEDKDEEGEDEDEDEDEVEVEVEVEVEDEDEDEDEDDEVEDEVDEDASSDDDEDQSPTSSFQARLERLRKRVSNQDGGAKAKGKERTDLDMDDMFDSEDDWDQNRTWAERDEDFIAHIQDILDQDEDISVRLDKKTQKKVFQAIYNGDFEEEDMWKPARKAKDKDKDLPPELAERWKKDRAKKAIRKQERELSKLVAAADPLTKKKGGKKGRKAMLAAAKLDPTITVLPNRVIDMTTLVQQIRRFIDEIGGPSMMSLPPANKQTRKDIHELASVFNLKSQSKGHGDARYTTLIKTTKTGLKVNNKKVAKIVRRSGGLVNDAEFVGGSDMWQKYAERSKVNKSMPKHREGDEVGKTAPKINETNIGFKMLASMGWSDGDPIGRSGGLQNPLTAVIKHTKLGLGAMK